MKTNTDTCPTCRGSGWVWVDDPIDPYTRECPACSGTGRVKAITNASHNWPVVMACSLLFMLVGCEIHHRVTVEFLRPEWLPERQATSQPADERQTAEEILEELIE